MTSIKCLIIDYDKGDAWKTDFLILFLSYWNDDWAGIISHKFSCFPQEEGMGEPALLWLLKYMISVISVPSGKYFSICQFSIQFRVVFQKNRVSTLETFVKSDSSSQVLWSISKGTVWFMFWGILHCKSLSKMYRNWYGTGWSQYNWHWSEETNPDN